MFKNYHHITARGFSLVEGVLAAGLFVLMISAVFGAMVYGQQAIAEAGAQQRAISLTDEAMAIVRNFAQASYTNLIDGNYEMLLVNGKWMLGPVTGGNAEFTVRVTIAPVDSNTKKVTASTVWKKNPTRNGNVNVETYFTNWALYVAPQSDGLSINTSGAKITGNGKADVTGIKLSNTSSDNVTINRLIVSWDPNNQNIKSVTIDGSTVWSGDNVPSGSTLDLQPDVVLRPSDDNIPIAFYFDGNVKEKIFTIIFQLGDDSEKTVTFGPL